MRTRLWIGVLAALILALPANAQAKLVPAGEIGKGDFGHSVAISADGNTALVGGWFDDGETGAAWVFARSGTSWIEQAKLTVGARRSLFGAAVALSADGDSALIGAPGSDSAWMFTREDATWSVAGSFAGRGMFGYSVALSGDGQTALVGGWNAGGGVGSASVFTQVVPGGEWMQRTLSPTNEIGPAEFGESVSLSADGNRALVGGCCDNGRTGAAWVFGRSGTTWGQEAKLTGSEGAGNGMFGSSVALSEDGTTALIGGCCEGSADEDNRGRGAAWVFTSHGATWAQQGKKLTPSDEIGEGNFGESVALANDRALIGGPADDGYVGAAWVFAPDGNQWSQTERLTGVEEVGQAEFGQSVALSADGETALVGGCCDEAGTGAVWTWPAPPVQPPALTPPVVTPARTPAVSAPTPTTKVSTPVVRPLSPLLTERQARKAIAAHVARVGRCRRLSAVEFSCVVRVHKRQRHARAELSKGHVRVTIG